MKRVVALLVILIVVGGLVFLYLPRGADSAFAATLAILNTDITAQRGGQGDFAVALDGDAYQNGDVVKSSQDGRAVLTFFDGSTLTVERGSQVKVATLNHLDNGGIEVVIEQTLGRTWASVEKLKTPASKFEIRTPTSTAAVRGTAFETNVEARPDGTVVVTYICDDGELLVTATAGGQTVVPANTQVSIATNQPAPANPTPVPPQPGLRLTASAGIGFALTAPSGATCGSAGNKAEIFGCLQGANTIRIRGPEPGAYVVLMTAAASAPNATLTVDVLRGTQVLATRVLTRTFNTGDLVRSGFTLAQDLASIGPFDEPQLVTSVCAAVSPGRVFSGGSLDERAGALTAFAQTSHGSAVAFVVTEPEVNARIAQELATRGSSVPVSGLAVDLTPSGVGFTGSVATPIGALDAKGKASLGAKAGTLTVRVRSLSAGFIPQLVLDQVRTQIDRAADESGLTFPFDVRRVALRDGCLAIIGTTR